MGWILSPVGLHALWVVAGGQGAGLPEPLPVSAYRGPVAAASANARDHGQSAAAPPDTAVQLRYDLRPGDHLVYRQVLERHTDSHGLHIISSIPGRARAERVESRIRVEWTNHVLVTAHQAGALVLGFQRNRTSAKLLRFTMNGEDRRRREGAAFARRLTGGERFSQANRITPRGSAQLPWSAVREWPSKALWDLYELQPLPGHPVRIGERWNGENALGFSLRAVGLERVRDEPCLRIEGIGDAELLIPRPEELKGRLRIRYWACPASGTVPRLEFDGIYPGALFEEVRETLVLELVERRRDERLRDWLLDPELQQGALAALLVSDTLAIEPSDVHTLVQSTNGEVQRQALALAFRARLPAPPLNAVGSLLSRGSPRVRALAVRVLESVPRDEARPLVERALTDSDYFVRDAALAWVRSRLPVSRAALVRSANDAAAVWPALSDPPLPRATDPNAAVRSARAQQPAGSPAASECSAAPGWSERLQWGKRASWQPPGTSLRGMTSEKFSGWPFAVHVPEDYRGDEPFPLLIYLSGNAGPALEGVLIAHQAVARTGYLVVYPNAAGRWWERQPTEMVDALIGEVLRLFNVDPKRIYISGLSNGGTGAFGYASLWPHRFSAAVLAMGAGLYGPSMEGSARPFAENVSNLPLLFLHGVEDRTIPASSTTRTVQALKPRFAPLEVHLFKALGHGVTLGQGDEGRTIRFFQQHVRRPFPRAVHFKTASLRFPRHYWVEIVEKDGGTPEVEGESVDEELANELRELFSRGVVAEVRGRIDEHRTIHLESRHVRRLRLLLRSELFGGSLEPVRVVLNGRDVFFGPLPHDCATITGSWIATDDPFLAYSAELTFDVPR